MNKTQLANYFDHTFLKPYATEADLTKLCNEAKEIGAAMVAINTTWTRFCKEQLKGTNVHVGAAISFPLGQTGLASKIAETKIAIEDGADEIDYVIDIGQAKMHRWDYIKEEMESIVSICREHNVISKVIFENCYLEKDEIKQVALIAKEVKPDFIKTSTGFGTGGATLEDVQLMVETVDGQVKVKAAGGIRDWKTCKAMIEAGAQRIGTSSSLKILEEFEAEVKYETDIASEEPMTLEESVALELENDEFIPTDVEESVNSNLQVDDSQTSHTQESRAEFATRMCRMVEAELKNKTFDEVTAEARAYISDREYAEYELDYEEKDDEDVSDKSKENET